MQFLGNHFRQVRQGGFLFSPIGIYSRKMFDYLNDAGSYQLIFIINLKLLLFVYIIKKKKKIEQLKILRQICFDSPAMQSDEGLLPRKPPPQSRCALCDDTLWNCNHYWNHLIWTQLVVPNKDPSDRSGQICALFPLLCWVLFRDPHLCLRVLSLVVIIVVIVTLWNCNNY